jgi:hypothetical protein
MKDVFPNYQIGDVDIKRKTVLVVWTHKNFTFLNMPPTTPLSTIVRIIVQGNAEHTNNG